MNGIIEINFNQERPTVSARELHKVLEVKKRFSVWFESNHQGFIEGIDFTSVPISTLVNNGAERELDDYNLTVEMAKHLCLMSRTAAGRQYRQYLIDVERAWNTPEQIIARALKLADQRIESLKQENGLLLMDNERMKPKEVFADAVTSSKTSILIGDLAKLLKQNGCNTGQKRLFEELRNKGYLMKSGSSRNMPTQRSMEMGLFEVKESTVTLPDESVRITRTTKVTGKGQQYFINMFLN